MSILYRITQGPKADANLSRWWRPDRKVILRLSRLISALEGDALDTADMFALIKDKEIIRPNIAGPDRSEWEFCREPVPIDPIEWLTDILHWRSGPEPDDMPFNGIDFHFHEICDHSPETVLRMMKGWHSNLAIETATETLGVVPGMKRCCANLRTTWTITSGTVRSFISRTTTGFTSGGRGARCHPALAGLVASFGCVQFSPRREPGILVHGHLSAGHRWSVQRDFGMVCLDFANKKAGDL